MVSTSKILDTNGPKKHQCCVCYYAYNRTNRAPVAVSCGHTFCKRCTEKLTTEKLFSCGVCRTVSIIGMKGIEKNLTLIELLESLNLLASDDIVEDKNETTEVSSEIMESQAHAIIDNIQTLSNFMKHKFGDDTDAPVVFKDAIEAVKEAFGFYDLASLEEQARANGALNLSFYFPIFTHFFTPFKPKGNSQPANAGIDESDAHDSNVDD
uniref:RING-type domain-containing protein n=1 Tax=Panagrellus redivivus TaxID=6233 RepID=A0A7E4UL54_PANRE